MHHYKICSGTVFQKFILKLQLLSGSKEVEKHRLKLILLSISQNFVTYRSKKFALILYFAIWVADLNNWKNFSKNVLF